MRVRNQQKDSRATLGGLAFRSDGEARDKTWKLTDAKIGAVAFETTSDIVIAAQQVYFSQLALSIGMFPPVSKKQEFYGGLILACVYEQMLAKMDAPDQPELSVDELVEVEFTAFDENITSIKEAFKGAYGEDETMRVTRYIAQKFAPTAA